MHEAGWWTLSGAGAAIAQVKNAIDATRELGGMNYIVWGDWEGYETLSSTEVKREQEQSRGSCTWQWNTCRRSASKVSSLMNQDLRNLRNTT